MRTPVLDRSTRGAPGPSVAFTIIHLVVILFVGRKGPTKGVPSLDTVHKYPCQRKVGVSLG